MNCYAVLLFCYSPNSLSQDGGATFPAEAEELGSQKDEHRLLRVTPRSQPCFLELMGPKTIEVGLHTTGAGDWNR